MDIKIDRTTLPKDGQKVVFNTYHMDGLRGEFVDGDDIFFVNNHEYYLAYDVESWEPLTNEE